ncbi:MAG: YidC/Oxa1 family membrane protein insertase [Firmicutes bacterium]|nr:YidC/Oxa1 family membrane protein insertase [Bacillota bacterium]
MALTELITSFVRFLRDITGSDGLAIIAFTVLLRLALYPLTLRQTKSMEEMKLLQPKMQELQEKYGSQSEEYQRRVMELYKTYNINPLGGCLPTLIQLPIIWALFAALRTYPFAESFLWIPDLGKTDWILAILAGAGTYLQSAMMSTESSQKMMSIVMTGFITWLGGTQFPAAVTLYWVVTMGIEMLQRWLISRSAGMKRRVEELSSHTEKGSTPKALLDNPQQGSKGEDKDDSKR